MTNMHEEFSEQVVVAALLSQEYEPEQMRALVSPKHFLDERLSCMYKKILQLSKTGKNYDFISIKREFPEFKEYIADIARDASTLNVVAHAKEVHSASKVRDFKNQLKEHIQNVRTIEDIEMSKLKLTESNDEKFETLSHREMIVNAFDEIEKYSTHEYQRKIIPYPVPILQRHTDGMHPGQLVVVAARTSLGKSAFAMQVAWEAVKHGCNGLCFHLEMNQIEVTKRLTAFEIRKPYKQITDMDKTVFITKQLAVPGNLYSEFHAFDIDEIQAKIVYANSMNMCDFVVIDYLGLIKGYENVRTHERLGRYTRDIKILARRLDIPIMILAQINREGEGEQPKLSQIKDSGSIEQDADVCILIHGDRDQEGDYRDVLLGIPKNRNGATGWFRSISHVYHGATFRFSERQ